MQFWTIGHSNQPLERFLDAVAAHRMAMIADVRRFPVSRRYPHFSKERLAAALKEHGVDYLHLPELGGRRSPRKNSRNTAWKNAGFRGYADYMETREFEAGIARLLDEASRPGSRPAGHRRVAIMCAELLWWQCHRSLISDYLKARGHEVTHVVSPAKAEPHLYTSAARIVDGALSYEGLL